MNYKIIKRSDEKDEKLKKDSDIFFLNFSDRNYDLPLHGCDNFTGNLQIGDIIGIKLECELKYKMKFPDIIRNDKKNEYQELCLDKKSIEEHLFKIIKINDGDIFVQFHFIDNDKIILRKNYNPSICIDIPLDYLKDYAII